MPTPIALNADSTEAAECAAIERLLPPQEQAVALHDTRTSRQIEADAQAALPPHRLMHRAGLAVARLGLALAPHAQRIWIACGPGNNGGDGLLAATHLHLAGKRVEVSWLGQPDKLPHDAQDALAQARSAGVFFLEQGPQTPLAEHDLAIDALLGLGATRPPEGRLAQAVQHLNACRSKVLAVDLPTGLDANTGHLLHPSLCVRASDTLSLLTVKPGLLTGHGRDQVGTLWWCDLGVDGRAYTPTAWLTGAQAAMQALAPRRHVQHKGSFGDVVVIGGASGMTGAALLAAQAALRRGAGRVYVHLLDDSAADVCHGNTHQPELMFRRPMDGFGEHAGGYTVVCGCGGGQAVHAVLPQLLLDAPRLLLDADALNALAEDAPLRAQLAARQARGQTTILTPHPLEAARLLGISTQQLQADRLQYAQRLAQQTHSIVVLKGSGTIVASPASTPWINPTGNARLGTAGTGDVLAGWIAALWAQGLQAEAAAVSAVFQHGWRADRWPNDQALVASALSA